jgi:hypothetical protein
MTRGYKYRLKAGMTRGYEYHLKADMTKRIWMPVAAKD